MKARKITLPTPEGMSANTMYLDCEPRWINKKLVCLRGCVRAAFVAIDHSGIDSSACIGQTEANGIVEFIRPVASAIG